jgi:hypothetical protein
MFKKPMLLNGALLLLSGVLIYNVSRMWLSSSPPLTVNGVMKQPETEDVSSEKKGDKGKRVSAGAYDVIGRQNVFRPQRREWTPPPPPPASPKPVPEVKKEPEPPTPPPLPDPAVMGIIVEENGERIAIMQGHRREEIAVRSRRRGRIPVRIVADKVGTYHEGDTISEAVIVEIQEDKVIIERDGERIELALGNKAAERTRPSSARKSRPTPSPYKHPGVSPSTGYKQPAGSSPPPLPNDGLTREERMEKFKASRRQRLHRRLRYPLPTRDK